MSRCFDDARDDPKVGVIILTGMLLPDSIEGAMNPSSQRVSAWWGGPLSERCNAPFLSIENLQGLGLRLSAVEATKGCAVWADMLEQIQFPD